MTAIDQIAAVAPIVERRPIEGAASAEPAGPVDLAGSFAQALVEARAHERAATAADARFAAGEPGLGIHEVMIESEKATLAVRYATTLKNKAVEAYRELMNTQV